MGHEVRPETYDVVEVALRQAGVTGITANSTVRITLTLLYRTPLPWWQHYQEREFKRTGFDNVVLYCVGAGLARIKGYAVDPTVRVDQTLFEALSTSVHEYLDSIRRHYDGPRNFSNTHDTWIDPDPVFIDRTDDFDEWISSVDGEEPEEDRITHPDLLNLYDRLNEKDKQLFDLISSGLTPTKAGLNMGMSEAWGKNRVYKWRRMLDLAPITRRGRL